MSVCQRPNIACQTGLSLPLRYCSSVDSASPRRQDSTFAVDVAYWLGCHCRVGQLRSWCGFSLVASLTYSGLSAHRIRRNAGAVLTGKSLPFRLFAALTDVDRSGQSSPVRQGLRFKRFFERFHVFPVDTQCTSLLVSNRCQRSCECSPWPPNACYSSTTSTSASWLAVHAFKN